MCDGGQRNYLIRLVACGAVLLAVLFGGTAAFADEAAADYPSRPIHYIVPYPPGAFNDTLGRVISQKLQEAWGVSVVVENRAGGGTLIGSEAVAKAPPDGYTLLGVAFPFGANPSIYKKLPYDTLKDFRPVIFAGRTPNLLVVRPEIPATTVKELIALVKADPAKYSYGSAGIGSSNHLSMELFKSMAQIKIVHVPYKGSAPMVNDLIGGHIDMAFDNTPNVLPQVVAGKLRAIAVSSTARSPLAPDVPTVAEAGLPGYEVNVWFGVVAPAGVPDAIAEKLNKQINAILMLPDVKRLFSEQGVEPVGGPPRQFESHIQAEIKKWAVVVKDAGIQPE